MLQLLTNYSDKEQSKLEYIVEASLDSGFDSIQFSWKRDDAEKRLENVKELVDRYKAKLIVNNSIDLAKKFNADYIHIGPNDISIDKIKKEIPNIKIGFSIHPNYYIKELEFDIDYFGVGPVYKTVTFTGHNETFGIERFRSLVKNVKKPICAIGGINLKNIEYIKETGCKSICVAGCIYRANNPSAAAKSLVNIWNSSK